MVVCGLFARSVKLFQLVEFVKETALMLANRMVMPESVTEMSGSRTVILAPVPKLVLLY